MSKEVLTIYTIGYRQANAAQQIENLVAQGYRLVDIRMRAGSRYKPAYNLRQLCQRFGMIYHRLRELGNINYPRRHARAGQSGRGDREGAPHPPDGAGQRDHLALRLRELAGLPSEPGRGLAA